MIEEKGHGFKEHFSEVLAGITILKENRVWQWPVLLES